MKAQRQLRECPCGTLTADDACPYCGRPTYPLWTVHVSDGRCVGYVAGFNELDALESVRQTPAYDRYYSVQVRPSFSTPEQGPIHD